MLRASVAIAFAALLSACGSGFTDVRPPEYRNTAMQEASAPPPSPLPSWNAEPATQPAPEHDHEGDDLPAEPIAQAPGSAAARYAALDKPTCEAELGRRRIGFERVGEARGVLAPVRLTGPVGGVDFHSMLPASQRRTSPWDIYDCRLVLALDDLARILARYGIVEVVHFSVYRPPPSRFSGTGRRHAGGLAIDAGIFRTRDGRTINVEKDFHGRIGAPTCGPKATPIASLSESAAMLRHIVCDAADAQLFNVLLTPDYNWAHRNHFHLEVTAGVRWIYLH